MIERGWDLGPDGADGYFGPRTSAGRPTIPTRKGYPVSGVIWPETWRGAWEAAVTARAPHSGTFPAAGDAQDRAGRHSRARHRGPAGGRIILDEVGQGRPGAGGARAWLLGSSAAIVARVVGP